ncbi:MAG TPA: 50S ribosomal protein L32e [Candidatus Bathyarchaeia archaeon]|nr:50S ribosomal protein L32e [Candidatus Bathyarchaeia archaeon]
MTESEIPEISKASQAQKQKVKLRRRVKMNKPGFQRQEVWRYKRIRDRWRRPRGVDSKMRMDAKGWPETVNVGYGGPRNARHLHSSGYIEVLVRSLSQIDGLDPTTQAIRIAHDVGGKKRREIMTRAKEKNLHVFNPHELKLAREEVERKEEAKESKAEKKEVTEEAGTPSPTVIKKEDSDKEPR